MANGRTGATASCENCFFGANLLCAVSDGEPCASFRPEQPGGLRPPSQLRFMFRQERSMQVAWKFPTPSEQAVLHSAA
jgi:hypothetical protein